MSFVPRLPDESVNTSDAHPLREALVLLGGVVVLGFVAVLVLGWSLGLILGFIPPSWEVRVFEPLGRSMAGQEETDERNAGIQALLDRLATHWPDAPYSFRSSIVSNEVPNAFAAPGGLVLVTSGLVEQIESENELAFVLAHELGHFHSRDHIRSLGRGIAAGLIWMVMGQGEGAGAGLLQLGQLLGARSFDRGQESAADAFGLEIVQREYGHVAGAGDFFRKLPDAVTDETGHIGEELAGYLSTHPVSEDRIEALEALARERGWSDHGATRPFRISGSDGRDDGAEQP
jgi:predicted Zn-dependent protease